MLKLKYNFFDIIPKNLILKNHKNNTKQNFKLLRNAILHLPKNF